MTYKTAMLVALASAKRTSSLSLLSVKRGFFDTSESKIRFQPVDLEKHEGLGRCGSPLVFEKFEDDPRLCPVRYLRAYVKKTSAIRSSDRLFVCLLPPHGAAATATISRWLQKAIELSGQVGSGGSTRAASSSRALIKGVSLSTVLEAGDWARASTFRRFYFKPTELSFQSAVLI